MVIAAMASGFSPFPPLLCLPLGFIVDPIIVRRDERKKEVTSILLQSFSGMQGAGVGGNNPGHPIEAK